MPNKHYQINILNRCKLHKNLAIILKILIKILKRILICQYNQKILTFKTMLYKFLRHKNIFKLISLYNFKLYAIIINYLFIFLSLNIQRLDSYIVLTLINWKFKFLLFIF